MPRERLPPSRHHHPADAEHSRADPRQSDRPGLQTELALPPDQECEVQAPGRGGVQMRSQAWQRFGQILFVG